MRLGLAVAHEDLWGQDECSCPLLVLGRRLGRFVRQGSREEPVAILVQELVVSDRIDLRTEEHADAAPLADVVLQVLHLRFAQSRHVDEEDRAVLAEGLLIERILARHDQVDAAECFGVSNSD